MFTQVLSRTFAQIIRENYSKKLIVEVFSASLLYEEQGNGAGSSI